MQSMRRPIFLFLIVLMALRGLVGPVMAAGLDMQGALPTAEHMLALADAPSGADHATHTAHGAPAATEATDTHCADLAAVAALATAQQSQSAHPIGCSMGVADAGHGSHLTACYDCDICHTVVLHNSAAATFSPQAAGMPDAGNAPFVSAQATQAIKPPIA